MVLYDRDIYLFWDRQTTMHWMIDEVFKPMLHNLQRENFSDKLVGVYHQTFRKICQESPVQLETLLSRDNRELNGEKVIRYCRTFDGVFLSTFNTQYPTETPPSANHRKIVFERMYCSHLQNAFKELRTLDLKKSGGTMCNFAKSLCRLREGVFGTVFRVSDGGLRQSRWVVKVSKIKVGREHAVIQRTFGAIGRFDSNTREIIKRHLREIELVNIMNQDFDKLRSQLDSGNFSGAERDELRAKLSMLMRTQIECGKFGLQIFSDEYVLVRELEYMNQSNIGDYKANLLRQHRRLDIAQLTQVTFDLLMGLAFLHKRNIIHRNISADNVLVNVDRQSSLQKVVIAGFGNCKFFGKEADQQFMTLTNPMDMVTSIIPPEGIHRPSIPGL